MPQYGDLSRLVRADGRLADRSGFDFSEVDLVQVDAPQVEVFVAPVVEDETREILDGGPLRVVVAPLALRVPVTHGALGNVDVIENVQRQISRRVPALRLTIGRTHEEQRADQSRRRREIAGDSAQAAAVSGLRELRAVDPRLAHVPGRQADIVAHVVEMPGKDRRVGQGRNRIVIDVQLAAGVLDDDGVSSASCTAKWTGSSFSPDGWAHTSTVGSGL